MAKLWAGRFGKETDLEVNDFNSSILFDCRLYKEDITGSMAHAAMLGKQGIIAEEEADKIIEGLKGILKEIEAGKIQFSAEYEDIHMAMEQILTERIGVAGKRLHTARSRNDQVALDMRLYVKKEIGEIKKLVIGFMEELCDSSKKNLDTVMPGYTHLQRAQPVTFGHYMMAYANMMKRDVIRLDNCLDGVSDRDYCVELCSALSILMMHLSRFSEEIIAWCSWEFKFVELDDAFSTGSSIMPQKKNPDVCELVRGKTGRVYGSLFTLLTVLKGIPLAYNKDMQEDKEAVFDAIDTVKQCLRVLTPMFATMELCRENMKKAALKGFINATDCADYLTKKGMPFRDAYKTVGQLVAECVKQDKSLMDLTLDEYREHSGLFDEDIYDAIDLKTCVRGRNVTGGPSPEEVSRQIAVIERFIVTVQTA